MKNIDQHSKERPFMSIEEASTYLGVSKATLYQYTHKRILNFYKLRGKLVYFRKSDLDNFILSNQNLVKSQDQIESEADAIINKKTGGRS